MFIFKNVIKFKIKNIMTEAVKQKINFFDQVSNNNSNNLKSAHINKQSFGAREEMNSFGNYNSVPSK